MGISVGRDRAADGTAVVTVAGQIDFTNAEQITRGIREAVTQWSPSAVRLDLAGASFIDSTGLGAIIAGYRAASDAGADFTVVNPTPGFLRVLTVTGLAEVFGLARQEYLPPAS